MIPFAPGFFKSMVSPCIGARDDATHLFLFDGESSTDQPVDSIDNATNFTNYGSTWRSDGYGTNQYVYPPYDTAMYLTFASSAAYFRFNTIHNAAWMRANPWTWELFGYPGPDSEGGSTKVALGFGSNNHDSNGGWRLQVGTTNGSIQLRQPGGTNIDSAAGIINASAWRHYAVCFDGTYVYLCYHGTIVKKSSTALNTITSDDDLYHYGAAGGGFVTDRGFHYADCIRITHGTAIYTGAESDTYTIPNSCGFLSTTG